MHCAVSAAPLILGLQLSEIAMIPTPHRGFYSKSPANGLNLVTCWTGCSSAPGLLAISSVPPTSPPCDLLQALGEKNGNFLHHLATFVVGYIIGEQKPAVGPSSREERTTCCTTSPLVVGCIIAAKCSLCPAATSS